MKLRLCLTALLLAASRTALAQTGADTTTYAWLLRAAHDAVDRGEFDPNEDERQALFRKAEQYARRAVAANGADAEGHFELARAIGKTALTMGPRDKVKYAGVVHDEAMAAVRLNPKHAGALHVLGKWNSEVMQLNGITRLVAKRLLGGAVFGEASWENAQRYLEQAVALEPGRIIHRLDLAEVLAARGEKAKAREQYEWIARAPLTDYNDRHYKDEASRRSSDLR